MGQKYHRIDYIIKVALAPADIRFELWHNGQKLSKDNPIKIEWHAAQAPPDPPTTNNFDGLGQTLQTAATDGMTNGSKWSLARKPVTMTNNWG